MDRWDQDRRLNGGDGWALDESGEWVSKTPGASASDQGSGTGRPAAPARRRATRPSAIKPAPAPAPEPRNAATAEPPAAQAAPAAMPPPPAGRGVFGTLMVGFVIPAIAASAVLYVWKGPGREAALAHIEPLMVTLTAYRGDEANADGAALPVADEGCTPVRRGMAGSIVFQRSGACDTVR